MLQTFACDVFSTEVYIKSQKFISGIDICRSFPTYLPFYHLVLCRLPHELCGGCKPVQSSHFSLSLWGQLVEEAACKQNRFQSHAFVSDFLGNPLSSPSIVCPLAIFMMGCLVIIAPQAELKITLDRSCLAPLTGFTANSKITTRIPDTQSSAHMMKMRSGNVC